MSLDDRFDGAPVHDPYGPTPIERGPGRPHRGNYRTTDGVKVPSVTTIIDAFDAKAGLQSWRMRQSWEEGYEYGAARPGDKPPTKKEIKEAREAAARRGFRPEVIGRDAGFVGSTVHDAIECAIHGDDPLAVIDGAGLSQQQKKEALRAFGGWKQWRDQNKHLRFIATEVPLVSDDGGYGGTLDAIATDCGRIWVVDWKTSGRYYLSHIYQIGAYVQLVREVRGLKVDDAVIVRADKSSGRYGEILIGGDQLEHARKGFLSRLREFRRDAAFTNFYSTQLNPPRRKKGAA